MKTAKYVPNTIILDEFLTELRNELKKELVGVEQLSNGNGGFIVYYED